MILTVEDMEQAARDRGIPVRRVHQPICIHGGEPYSLPGERFIEPLTLFDEWSTEDTLLLYKVYMAPADELITVRYAVGVGSPHPDDV